MGEVQMVVVAALKMMASVEVLTEEFLMEALSMVLLVAAVILLSSLRPVR